MSLLEGTPLPDVNTTKSVSTTAPQFYTDYLTNLANSGNTAQAKTADQLVAPLTALQQQGYAAVPGAATAYQPGLATAEQTAGQAAGVSNADIARFMNPYTENVVNEMGRLSQQNMQRNLLPTLKAGFVGSGGLGSQRYAAGLGQGLADVQSNLTGQQYGALSSGYKSAVDQAMQEAQLQNQVAQTQGSLAGKEQELGLTGAGALTKAGGEQQAYEQAMLDAPLKAATNASNLLKGYTVPTSSTEHYTGPMPGAYAPSTLSQIAGLSTLIASGFNPGAGGQAGWGTNLVNAIGSGISSAYDKLTGGGSSDSGSTPTYSSGTDANGNTIYYNNQTGGYTDSNGNSVPISGGEGE